MKKVILSFILFFLNGLFLHAQTSLLSNLNTNYTQYLSNEGIEFKGALYYIAANSNNGSELWRTDGTPMGTYMLKDIFTGTGGAFESEVLNATVFQNKLYFIAKDIAHGYEIWVTDGTSSGTQLFVDVTPGVSSSAIGNLIVVNNRIVFELRNGFNTTLYSLNSINKTLTFLKSYEVIYTIFSMGNYAVFSGRLPGGVLGTDLWRTNGTPSGTYLLKDINPGLGNSFPSHFTKFGKLVMFDAFSDKYGYELWKSDGTSDGTQMISDIKNGPSDGLGGFYGPAIGAAQNGYFYFGANNGLHGFELWRTKGIVGDAVRLTDINPMEKSSLQNPSDIFSVGNKIIFRVNESNKCYSYDTLTTKIGITNFKNTYNLKMHFFDGIQYYASQDSIYGDELRCNDGIKEKLVQELTLNDNYQNPYSSSSFRIMGKIGNNIIFRYLDWEGTKFRSFDYTNQTFSAPEIVRSCWVNNSRSDLIWNRVAGATQYQIEYKSKNSFTWISKLIKQSFVILNNLTPSTSYVYRIRSNFDSGWSEWSPYRGFVHKQESAAYYATVISERSLNPQSQIIYWNKTPSTTKAHIRYRKANTLSWIDTLATSSPYTIISGLKSNTFYEYEIKGYSGNLSDNWSKHYFTTSSEVINDKYLAKTNNLVISNIDDSLWPNPTNHFQNNVNVKVNIKDLKVNYRLYITNSIGSLEQNKELNVVEGENLLNIDISKLVSGIHYITILDHFGNFVFNKKLIIL